MIKGRRGAKAAQGRMIRGREGLCAAGRQPQARTAPASPAAGGRRSGLPSDALIELVVGCRHGVGSEVTRSGRGRIPEGQTAGGRDARRRDGFAQVEEEVAANEQAQQAPAHALLHLPMAAASRPAAAWKTTASAEAGSNTPSMTAQ